MSSSNLNNLSSSNVDDIFGSSAASQSAAPASNASRPATASTAVPSKSGTSAFDDLDDDFEGLEDAKEGSADDDFANISRSGFDDFNPVFDSSPPPSQPKSESANTAAAFGVESSFDFGSLSTTSAAGSTAGPAPATGSSATAQQQPKPNAAESHDWDALFAGLDEQTPTASSQTLASSAGNAEKNNNSNNNTTAAAATNGTGAEPRPNAPGRALTEEGEHDDPILKNLTGMGYSRADALAALEKYDYNLERVSITTTTTTQPTYINHTGGNKKRARARA